MQEGKPKLVEGIVDEGVQVGETSVEFTLKKIYCFEGAGSIGFLDLESRK